jgi:putative transposase
VGAEAPHLFAINIVDGGKALTIEYNTAMNEYRKSSHAVYKCIYHFVWVPKYRYAVLVPKIKERLRDILRELCEWKDIDILEGGICADHVHMVLSVPPKFSPSSVMKTLKGKSAERLRKEFPDLAKRYWGMHIWARGYFVSTVGVDEEAIRKYIQNQEEDQKKEEQLRLWKD